MRRELGNTSLMTLPLTARGRTFGIISLGLTESGNFPGRRFDQADLDWAAELASHTAVALENARLYREAQEALAGLREADRQKNEFLAMLGHELRNPLMPLRNALELLAINNSDGREFNRLREMMNRQLGNLTRIIDELLDIARVVHGKLQLEKSWIPVSDVLARAVELADEQLRARAHKLYVRNPPEMLMIEGDAGRLAQAVANLLSNAAKYTDPAGRIELSGEQEDKEALIRVRDNGAGIAAEFLPAVFDLFSQAESSLDRSQGGLGIGLALVKRLVEMHGGRVSAHSAGLGRGSEFLIRLPARYAGIADHSARVDSDGLRTTAPAQRRIMVVDDNRDAAESLAMLLQIYGHQVSTVHDGLEAIGKAREFAPEVALLDLGLPGLDGYKLACQLRDSPPTANAVLIAVSGYGQPEDRRRSQEAGFDDHLLKPVDPAWLNGRIAELFAKRSAMSSK